MNKGIAVMACLLLAVIAAASVVLVARKPASGWQTAELRVSLYQGAYGQQSIDITCSAVGLSIKGPISAAKTVDDYYKEAMAKVGGTGPTLDARIASLGWEPVSSGHESRDAAGASESGAWLNTYFYRRPK